MLSIPISRNQNSGCIYQKGVTVTKQRYRQESKQNSKLWMDLPLDQEASVLWPSQPSTYAIL